MAKKKKKWVISAVVAPHITEIDRGAKTKKALANAKVLNDSDDDAENRKWWLAVSIAAILFGDGSSLDPQKDISGHTGDPDRASAIAGYTNETMPGACVLNHFRWDWVTTEEIGECGIVSDYVSLVQANIV